MEKCLITRIVKDSILDGPGCRYVVFVKGCHIRCPWCHNPETQSPLQEILTYPKFCIKCGKCLEAAPTGTPTDTLPIKVDNNRVDEYVSCVEACPTEALEFAAKYYTTDELIAGMKKYRTIYRRTKGGMTISGGEPIFMGDFSFELLTKARKAGFHTALDITGAYKWSAIERFLPVVKIWLYDFKHVDDKSLKTSLSIENLLKLSSIDNTRIWIRIPMIPGYNDTEPVWDEMARIIKKAGKTVEQVALLPFHPYGSSKYEALHKEYDFENYDTLDENVLVQAEEVFTRHLPPKMIILGRRILHG